MLILPATSGWHRRIFAIRGTGFHTENYVGNPTNQENAPTLGVLESGRWGVETAFFNYQATRGSPANDDNSMTGKSRWTLSA
jgi:hypothetical protein